MVDAIPVETLAHLVGLKRRRIAQLASEGKIPGAVRTNGYHFRYPDTEELRTWIKEQNSSRTLGDGSRWGPQTRRKKTSGAGSGGLTFLHQPRANFEHWLKRIGGRNAILALEQEKKIELLEGLSEFEDLLHAIRKSLQNHSTD
ncbi:MAG TPA: hypothetical protein VIM61_01420 [Chthoniobacterales bacterium]